MLKQLDNLWWVALLTVPIVAGLVWRMKKPSTIKSMNIKYHIATLGLLLLMAASLYRSATGESNDHIPNLSRVLLGFDILCIVVISSSIVRRIRTKKESPNQAL